MKMRSFPRRLHVEPLTSSLLLLSLLGALACGESPELGHENDGDDSGREDGGPDTEIPPDRLGSDDDGEDEERPPSVDDFDLDTLTIVKNGGNNLDIDLAEPLPTIQFKATVSGRDTSVGWSVDRGALGSIDETGLFTPTGNVGGFITIRAGLNDKVVTFKLLIRISSSQNGPRPEDAGQIAQSAGQLTQGGGIGGVGGEGLGAALADPDLLALLEGGATNTGSSLGLELLYPYDGTVFPRGMLAPLLMWRWGDPTGPGVPQDTDAIQIELRTQSGSFQWKGRFAAPEILGTTGKDFIRHPIPQSVWERATESAGEILADGSSDALQLSLSLVRGATVYGPLSRSFLVAPGRLTGTVYYNSYGTNLAENYQDTRNGQPNNFGAAVLGIRSGETSPSLVSGYDSDNHDGCRACHTVSSQGSHLLVQGGGSDSMSQWRDLLNDDADTNETYLSGQDWIFAWAGLSPDGNLALTNSVNASRLNPTVSSSHPHSVLYDMSTSPPSVVNDTGLPTDFKAALPSFSHDGKHVAFAYLGGTGPDIPEALPTDGSQLALLDFDPETRKFSNFRVVATGHANQASTYRAHGAGWPSFSPLSTRLVFQNEVRGSRENESYIGTRDEARGELWWTNTETKQMTRLDYLNGKDSSGTSYLPIGPHKHGIGDGSHDDTSLTYEPTVAPITVGGYAWVVFTSRRMYGNLAKGDPWLSDPRNYDFKDYEQLTTKKLWIAAIRTDASDGEDPSYPAFYLPAQELIAGNARGFWVLDPCKTDGDSCATGDQCCGGYCQPDGENGALICSNETTSTSCSAEQERCSSTADCCNPAASCLNGFCGRPAPPIAR